MAVSPAVRVGILVFLAIMAFILVFLFLRGYAFLANRFVVVVTFDNALGLIEGAEVRMAGVPIGRVASVTLDEDKRARVCLDINRKYCVPPGSRFVIQTGVLISQQFIEVFPNRDEKACIADGAEVEGETTVRIEELVPRAQVILDNLASISSDMRELVGNEAFQKNILRSAENVAKVTARLDRTIALIQGAVLRSQEEVDAVVSNLRLASASVRDMAAKLETLISDPGLQEDIRGTFSATRRSAETLEEASASVERTAGSVEKLLTAPEFQDDIRQTVAETRLAVDEAREAIKRVNRVLGSGGGPSANLSTLGMNVDTLFIPDDDRIRVELSTTIPLSANRFLALGLYDLGGGNKLILQAGQPLGSRTDLRYGLYASSLGIGLDYDFSSKSFGRLDLFDTENMTLNLRAGYRFTDEWGVLLGVDDLLGDNKATLGVQLTK